MNLMKPSASGQRRTDLRKPKHFSPTSFALWELDKDRYYQMYLANQRFAKDAQSIQMAIGSAFDFLVKSFLIKALPKTKLSAAAATDKLVCQIEPHVLDEAMRHGKDVFEVYSKSGALASLMSEIVSDARFEFGVTGKFNQDDVLIESGEFISRDATDALLLNGRPDGIYKTRAAFTSPLVDVVTDFKVNGWMSGKSPDPGFIGIFNADGKYGLPHKDVFVSQFHGVKLTKPITNPWMSQLSIYGWVMGVPVGTPFIGQIHQIVGPPEKARIALHRFLIPEAFQVALMRRIREAWEIVNSDWIFRDLSKEQSKAKCDALEIIHSETADDFDEIMNQRER